MRTSPDGALRVGMFHHGGASDGVIVGRTVAVASMLSALARHGKRCRYPIFGTPHELAAFERLHPDLGAVSLRHRDELMTGDVAAELGAWHDPDFFPAAPFAWREQNDANFPITTLHHTLSYKELLHDRILPLLLARPRAHDAVVCSSRAARRALESLLGHVAEQMNGAHGTRLDPRVRLEVIPLAVDTDRFHPGDRAAARRRFQVSDGSFAILWVGRLSAVDKADLVPLIDVFAELTARHSARDPLLLLAGRQRPGERYGDVLARYAVDRGVGDRVRVLDEVGDDLDDLYRAADVFVAPTDNLQESFGLAPVEAMASGVPQVVSDWDGYRDTVEHDVTGLLVPSYWAACTTDLEDAAAFQDSVFHHLVTAQSVAIDPSALASALDRLICDEALRRSMAARSRERAVERFSWSVVVGAYEALWCELAEHARNAGPPPPSAPGLGYARPRYAAAFGHYATMLLDDQTLLRLTDRGRTLLRGELELPAHYNSQWRYLDVALLQRALVGFAKLDAKGQPVSIGQLLAVLTKNSARARDSVLRCALWLLKYRFVERVS